MKSKKADVEDVQGLNDLLPGIPPSDDGAGGPTSSEIQPEVSGAGTAAGAAKAPAATPAPAVGPIESGASSAPTTLEDVC